MKRYLKPTIKELTPVEELCGPGLNGSGGSGEQLTKENNMMFDETSNEEVPSQRSVWDE
jgi:hypothetical protein